MKKDYFTQAEILRRLPFGVYALNKGIEEGRFPRPITFGSRVKRWKSSDVERLIADLMATAK